MIIATHIILTAYGHWLPNDPRGSLSTELRALDLASLGNVHFGRRASQPTREQLRAFYRIAERQLAHDILWFDTPYRTAISDAIGSVVRHEKLTCYACAILRNHVHVLVRRHRLKPDQIEHRLKTTSREAARLIPRTPDVHPVWSKDSCTIFKDSVQAMRACVTYIEGNPAKHRLPAQRWPFVTPYDDWPFHKRTSTASRPSAAARL